MKQLKFLAVTICVLFTLTVFVLSSLRSITVEQNCTGYLKASEGELLKVDSTTSALEKSNLLMKLRETILGSGKNGDNLTVPDGISRYPNNALWRGFWWAALLSVVAAVTLAWLYTDDH